MGTLPLLSPSSFPTSLLMYTCWQSRNLDPSLVSFFIPRVQFCLHNAMSSGDMVNVQQSTSQEEKEARFVVLVHFGGVYTPNVANFKLPTVEQLACKIPGKLSGARASLLPPTRELHPAPAHCSLPGFPLVPATSIPSWANATCLTDSPGSSTVILWKWRSNCLPSVHGSVSPPFKLC